MTAKRKLQPLAPKAKFLARTTTDASTKRRLAYVQTTQIRVARKPVEAVLSRFFFPARGGEPQVLEERVRDHGHQRMAMKTGPGAALEVVEAELLLHLLVRLLAHPARLDRGRQRLERRPAGRLER